jgi:hypothetical protein
MNRRRALERWKTKAGNYEITRQVLWLFAKSLMKRGWTKAPTAVYGCLGITCQPNEKAYLIADWLKNQFTSHDLCDENHERRVETIVQALLASVDDTPLGKVRLCGIHKLVNSLKQRKPCGLDGMPNECLWHLPRRPLVNLTHFFNQCLRLSHFRSCWKKQNL